MPEKELGPESLESKPGYLVNNQVCFPNTRSPPLGVHAKPFPPQGGPPQPCGLGWRPEEGAAYLGYRQEASHTVGMLWEIS